MAGNVAFASKTMGRLAMEAPESASGDSAAAGASLFGVGGEGLASVQVYIALDGQAQRPAQFPDLAHADEADLREAHSEIAEAVGDVVVAEFGQGVSTTRTLRADGRLARASIRAPKSGTLAASARVRRVKGFGTRSPGDGAFFAARKAPSANPVQECVDDEFMLARIGEHHSVHVHVRQRGADTFQ